tara:strand:- start:342 stop:710 length:369 start_codon:yes stop_codon:yes gene_type:complete
MKKFYNNFIASIKKGILQTFTFSGKSNRFEFATYFITTSVAYYAFTILLVTKFEEFYVSFVGLWIILAIILGISQLANTVRRLNYLGDSMWLLILVLIPILNLLFIVYLCVGSSESEIKSDT